MLLIIWNDVFELLKIQIQAHKMKNACGRLLITRLDLDTYIKKLFTYLKLLCPFIKIQRETFVCKSNLESTEFLKNNNRQ